MSNTKNETLGFFKWTLSGILILFLLATGAHLWIDNAATAEAFEAAKTILLPMATLIIGFCFGRYA